jgi:uncharacterized RDD family membrane protein YckC
VQENSSEAVSMVETMETTTTDASPAVINPTASTLIEFPGASRASRPQWRKELSERVREIQQRRAGAGAFTQELEEPAQKIADQPAAEAVIPQLGLVPQQDAPAVNPIVAAALKRLERARQTYPPMTRTRASMSGGAATAVARVAEEQYGVEAGMAPATPLVPAQIPDEQAATDAALEAKTAKPAREHSLVVVPALPAPKEPVPVTKPQPKRVKTETKNEAARVEPAVETLEPLIEEETYDDRAPIISRLVGSMIDILVVAFASSPFAAIIELTNGNWADWRVLASMGGIILIVMFLYLTAATALAGRTWGMSLVSLRAVDADTGLPPTTGQSVMRALLYIASLITLGLGILYALMDAEGRTAHDYFSGTAVVRE